MFTRRKLLASAASVALARPAYAWTHGQGGGAVSLQSVVGLGPTVINMFQATVGDRTDFTQTFWYTPNQSSVTTQATGFFASGSVNSLIENTANSTHNLQPAFVGTNQVNCNQPFPFRLALIAKAAGRTRVVLSWAIGGVSGSDVSAGFDLAGGNTGYDNSAGANATISSTSMTSIGSGWWLCLLNFSVSVSSGGGQNPQIFLDNGSGTAARSTTYTGDGTSGIQMLWHGMLPAGAFLINSLNFSDNFSNLSSTIDLANTKAPGFKWYINNNWPNCPIQIPDLDQGPTSASYLTNSSPLVLQILNPNTDQGGYTSEIMSACTDGSNGYVGNAWGAPVIFDGTITWDATTAGFDSNWHPWPAFWGESIEFRTGNLVGPGNFYLELDFFESQYPITQNSISTTSTIHLWNTSGTQIFFQSQGNGVSVNTSVFNRFSCLWVNGAISGNGFACMFNFMNGAFVTSQDFYWDVTSGAGQATDGHHIPIIINTGENITLNAGGGWPLFIDQVRVYTP